MALARNIHDLELLIELAATVPRLWQLGVARLTNTDFYFTTWLLITDGYLAETPKISEVPDHTTETPEFRLVLFRPALHEFRPKRRNSGDSGISRRNAETAINSQA